MIRVTVGNNMSRKNVIVSEDTTIRQILEDNGIDYSRTAMCLDGATLVAGDMDKAIGDFGITERCFLLGVQKTDNA